MTDDLADFRQWRDTVETRLGTLEATVGEQARLRAAMDEDLSKLHVERKLLQALHDTQQHHTAQLRELRAGQEELKTEVGELKTEVGAIQGRLTTVEGTLRKVHVGVEAIRDLLERNFTGDN